MMIETVGALVAKTLLTKALGGAASGAWKRAAARWKGGIEEEVARCIGAGVDAFVEALPGLDRGERNTVVELFTEGELARLIAPLGVGDATQVDNVLVLAALRKTLRSDGWSEAELAEAWDAFLGAWRAALVGTDRLLKLSELVQRERTVPPRVTPNLGAYLEGVADATGHIKVRGISSATGAVQSAGRHPIETLYTPLHTTGGDRLLGRGAQGLAQVFGAEYRLLVVGAPGTGKTTFVQLVASLLARDMLGVPGPNGEGWAAHHLGLTRETPRIPVWIELRDLVLRMREKPKPPQDDDERWLLSMLEESGEGEVRPYGDEDWRGLLEGGGAVLLFDGLDEVHGKDAADRDLRERVFAVLRASLKAFPGCRVLVTSRPFDTEALGEMGFESVTIGGFGRDDIRAFLRRWVHALFGVAPGTAEGREAERQRAELEGAILDRPRIRRMAANPVMLTCLCVVHWQEGELPQGKSRLYAAVTRWLLRAREQRREAAGFNDRFAINAFGDLALRMMGPAPGEAKRASSGLADAAQAVRAPIERWFRDLRGDPRGCDEQAKLWLRGEPLWSGLLAQRSRGEVRFWHLTFQEYFAARALAALEPVEWQAVLECRLTNPYWREVVELFPGCLLDEGGQRRVDTLVEWALGLREREGDGLAGHAYVVGVVGRLLDHLRVYKYVPPPEVDDAYAESLGVAERIFEREGADAVPFDDRLAAAEALGLAGDPRLREPVVDRLLEVPGAGHLGRFPVTVREYQSFVDHDGYAERAHWSDDGWRWRSEKEVAEPGGWAGQLEHPTRPVTEVSWYEARAYCRWLSELTGQPLDLSKVAHWEMAAKHPAGPYPWGDEEANPERHANFGQHVGAPTPVGLYPHGAGPHGHLDLAGNVWEWCIDMQDRGRFPLRGGGWSHGATRLGAVVWSVGDPGDRDDDIGFRIARPPRAAV